MHIRVIFGIIEYMLKLEVSFLRKFSSRIKILLYSLFAEEEVNFSNSLSQETSKYGRMPLKKL